MAYNRHPEFQKLDLKLFEGLVSILAIPTLAFVLGCPQDLLPCRELLVRGLDDVLRPVFLFPSVLCAEVVIVWSYYPVKVGEKSVCEPEICLQSTWLFIRIECSSFPNQVDLRGLEAAEDDTARPCQHTLRAVKA